MSTPESPRPGRAADDERVETPAQRAAREKADALIARREHPTRDDSELDRPRTVVIGCLMTWFGAAVIAWFGVLRITADASSSLVSGVEPEDVDATLTAVRIGGWLWVGWAIVLLVVGSYAFLGMQWAATGIFLAACVFIPIALIMMISGVAWLAVPALAWSFVAATLIRSREVSQNWYRALAEARAG